MIMRVLKAASLLAMVTSAMLVLPAAAAHADSSVPAKTLFGARTEPTAAAPASIGFYAKGCLAGGRALPITGPTWQVMRLSRNRNWGHPAMIALIERLSREAAARDGWPGLLVGDISQPRGGPMVDGHASHQIGLDVDIWLTPMPGRVLSRRQRETMTARSVIKDGSMDLDPGRWTDAHGRLIMRAAGYDAVERIFVAPGIKKRLCRTWQGKRSILGKVRPYWGHKDHIHIRISCQPGSPGCTKQSAVPAGDGCGKQLAWWYTDEPWKPAKPAAPGAKPRETMLSDLPRACTGVLATPALPASVPVPLSRPRFQPARQQ